MNPKSLEARNKCENPFENFIIADTQPLEEIIRRTPCVQCGKSRMYFCYTCFLPVSSVLSRIPTCFLPLKIDIIKHSREIDGKSTAAHAAVLAPHHVKVYTYPNVPNYEVNGKTVLLYPGTDASTVKDLFTRQKCDKTYSEQLLSELPAGYNVGTLMTKVFKSEAEYKEIFHVGRFPIERVVLIDSTWNQSRGIYADERLKKLPKIVLQNRASHFWRHQKGSPRWYLSTIEALHQLLLELHLCAWGCSTNYQNYLTVDYPIHDPNENHPQCSPYVGQYDNLLYFFKFLYMKLHNLYKHEDLLAYKRPMS